MPHNQHNLNTREAPRGSVAQRTGAPAAELALRREKVGGSGAAGARSPRAADDFSIGAAAGPENESAEVWAGVPGMIRRESREAGLCARGYAGGESIWTEPLAGES